jgi:hypothetical protein
MTQMKKGRTIQGALGDLAAQDMESVKKNLQKLEKAVSCDRWYPEETEEAALQAWVNHLIYFGVVSRSTVDYSKRDLIRRMTFLDGIIAKCTTRL